MLMNCNFSIDVSCDDANVFRDVLQDTFDPIANAYGKTRRLHLSLADFPESLQHANANLHELTAARPISIKRTRTVVPCKKECDDKQPIAVHTMKVNIAAVSARMSALEARMNAISTENRGRLHSLEQGVQALAADVQTFTSRVEELDRKCAHSLHCVERIIRYLNAQSRARSAASTPTLQEVHGAPAPAAVQQAPETPRASLDTSRNTSQNTYSVPHTAYYYNARLGTGAPCKKPQI